MDGVKRLTKDTSFLPNNAQSGKVTDTDSYRYNRTVSIAEVLKAVFTNMEGKQNGAE
jgi:hypothetical protein